MMLNTDDHFSGYKLSVPKKAIHIKVSVWQLKKKVQENAFVSL